MVLNPELSIYPLLALWVLKLANGVLLLIRSKWVLLSIPAWIAALVLFVSMHGAWKDAQPDAFLAITLQGCILSFALWAYVRGYLKR